MCFGASIRPARAPRRVPWQSATRTAGCELCWSWRRLPPIPKGGTVYVFQPVRSRAAAAPQRYSGTRLRPKPFRPLPLVSW